MSRITKEIPDKVASWPQEDQDELADVAREIEARRNGVYVVNEDEETAIREGLAELVPGIRVE